MAVSRGDLVRQLRELGITPGDIVMVHASLRALGPVMGGPAEVAAALGEAVGPEGSLLAVVSWEHSPYDETLNGRQLSPAERETWPAFDPANAAPHPSFGALNRFLVQMPGSRRSGHPDASFWAWGTAADELVTPHELGSGLGPGSPLERFVAHGGQVLLLGAPPNSVTVLHYAEALADIPNKRRVRYAVPLLGPGGGKVWREVEELDTNGILDCYAGAGAPDSIELMARAYLEQGRHKVGLVGSAQCQLIDAADIVRFGVQWLEARHGAG
ncbi:aminoglycoside 3-N-acetyltransferase [Aquibaculum sediminis]|uniref:aminoglycoside 3-N-acetyltransferase n=1 Tax=Aquibaculum sediminis TaxID=3231907 RepID=UPI00345135A7